MKRKQKLKKPTILLMSMGIILMSFMLLTRHFFETPIDIVDFLKGIGVAFIVSSLIIQWKLERKVVC